MNKISQCNKRHMAGWLLALLIVALGRSPVAVALSALPDSISITEGRATLLSLSLPLYSDVGDKKSLFMRHGDTPAGTGLKESFHGVNVAESGW